MTMTMKRTIPFGVAAFVVGCVAEPLAPRDAPADAPPIGVPPGNAAAARDDVAVDGALQFVVEGAGSIDDAVDTLGARRCDGLPAMATHDPAQRGPFPVGVRTYEYNDVVRGRALPIEVWYPADESARGQQGVTYSLGMADLAALAGSEGAAALAAMALGNPSLLDVIYTDAVRDAPPAARDPARGVVVFSHGFRGIRYQSSFLTTHLASHGYLVVAPDHLGNTLFDGSDDGAVAAEKRIFDVAFLMDELERRVADPSDDLFSAFDPRRIAISGHSFGASTSIMVGAMDNREMAVVSLAPAFDDRMSGVFNPPSYDMRSALMAIGGSADDTCGWEHQQLAFDRTRAPRYAALLDGTRHMDFTDLCSNNLLRFVFANFIDQLADACGDDSTEFHGAIETLSTSMLNRYLACDPDTTVDGVAPHVMTWLAEDVAPPSAQSITAGMTIAPRPVTLAPTEATVGPYFASRYAGPNAAEPALLFVHGMSMDQRAFTSQIDAIGMDHPLILLDLPGHGRAPQSGPMTVDAWAADLDMVLDHFDVTAAVVVGWSSGGQVAMRYAADRAGDPRLAGLVLIDAAPLTQPDWLNFPDYNGGATLELVDALRLALLDASLWPGVVDKFTHRGVDNSFVREVALSVPEATWRAQLDNERPNLLPALSSIDVPTLVMHGELDDSLLLESGEYLARAIANADIVVFHRSGHSPFLEEPDAFNAKLRAWIDAL